MDKNSPFFSIITPSFNQGKFIRETIESVLQQQASLEYIVRDNLSTDNTPQILEGYSDRLQAVRSTDGGQANAINLGWKMAHGQWLAWLNSDDLYEPDALATVAKAAQENPEARWIVGFFRIINEEGKPVGKIHSAYKNFLLSHYHYNLLVSENIIPQMSVFIRRDLVEEAGPLLENDSLTFDYEYWLRLGKIAPPLVLKQHLSVFRYYKTSKTGTSFREQFTRELRYAQQYVQTARWPLWLHTINYYKTLWFYHWVKQF